jgi:antitoxin (DNA-binding transcriptional repressor) of toxin-antitoxin stability system
MKTAVVKNLKNKLSEYLREVRAGVRVVVWDRHTAVAELHEPCLDRSLTVSLNAPLCDWARSRTVRLPSSEKRKLDISPVHEPDGTVLKLLDQDRGEAGS